MRKVIAGYWPLGLALLLLALLTALLLLLAIDQNGGRLVYGLDDTYIHMSVARNLAEHGIFGVTPYRFSAAESSLLWPLLLALTYAVTGVTEAAPLILNAIFAVLVIAAVHVVLLRYGVPAWLIFVLLMLVAFSAPLFKLVFIGMEHTLQILLSVLFMAEAVPLLCREEPAQPHGRAGVVLMLLAFLLGTVRYDSAFLVGVVALMLMARRQTRLALLVGAAFALPIVVFGVISLAQGSMFLPNSVLLNGILPSSVETRTPFLQPDEIYKEITRARGLLGLLLLILVGFLMRYNRRPELWTAPILVPIIWLATTLLHAQFGLIRGFDRYEAYLVVLGLIAVALLVKEPFAGRLLVMIRRWQPVTALGVAVAVYIGLFGLSDRINHALMTGFQGMHDIYLQQVQMALFLDAYYPTTTVAANDIGAITFYTDIDLVDLVGLATVEVARARTGGDYDAAFIEALTAERNAPIALIYDEWFEGRIPGSWTKVAEWTVPEVHVLGGPTVSFYAVDPAEVEPLARYLAAFEGRLPAAVLVENYR